MVFLDSFVLSLTFLIKYGYAGIAAVYGPRGRLCVFAGSERKAKVRVCGAVEWGGVRSANERGLAQVRRNAVSAYVRCVS